MGGLVIESIPGGAVVNHIAPSDFREHLASAPRVGTLPRGTTESSWRWRADRRHITGPCRAVGR